jgi:hypothetical protein
VTIDLGYDFHETKQGLRLTISEAAHSEVLDRLLALNHQHHAEEVAVGLHMKKTTKASGSQGKRGCNNATITPSSQLQLLI